MKPILEIQNISKTFQIHHEKQAYLSIRDSLTSIFKKSNSSDEVFYALKDVSFDVFPGDSIGIIGRNGAGKSTLLKILSKITPPTAGKIISRGRIASLLEVGTGFHPELTGRENVFLNGSILGMKRAEIQKNFDAIIDFSGVEKFLDTPLKHYSSGMQLRLAFAVAAFLENEILIIDEVLAVGDAEFQKKCMGKMEDVSKNLGRTILFVSHNLAALRNLCRSAVFFNQGKLIDFDSSDIIISQYLNSSTDLNNSKSYINKPVENVHIIQKEETIVITLKYSLSQIINLPVFGFTIKDNFGNVLFGSNPLYQRPKETVRPSKKGEIIVTIKNPKLWNGTYKASIWFGDDLSDFFNDEDCLTFDVINMVNYFKSPPQNIGSIAPEVDWNYINQI